VGRERGVERNIAIGTRTAVFRAAVVVK
jgi:hypothetical protein